MKKHTLRFAVIIFLAGVIGWVIWHNKTVGSNESAVTSVAGKLTNGFTSNGFGNNKLTDKNIEEKLNKIFAATSDPAYARYYYEQTKIDPQFEWKQPISFYGRALDQSNAAVSGASIHFTWNDISEKGTSDADTTSDNNGWFSLTGRRGKAMTVVVSKDGYYGRSCSYEYADPYNGLFRPDPNNPVIFYLRKKGAGANLIISQSGMSTFIRIAPPTNGSPVFVDFFNQQIGDAGQLKIEGWKERKNFKTTQNNWGFRLTIADGGLIEQNDEFPFEAPEASYQSVLEWHFKDADADWQAVVKKNFYIKFGTPPRYGKIAVDTSAFTPTVYLEYVINPDGSRNLEPK